jgi:2'-5' RNA ligase
MTADDASPRDERLFFALWPDAATAAALHRVATALLVPCGGRPSRRETLHLTLAFLGTVAAGRRAEVLDAGASLGADAFAFVLDHLGWWRHNRIVWAGSLAPCPALDGLVGELRAALAARRLPVEARPYVPHVTLLRKAERAPVAALMHASWSAARVSLMASRLAPAGASYVELAAWPLGGAAAADDDTGDQSATGTRQ